MDLGGDCPAIHVGNQGIINFSIVADQTDANVVFVGGDRPPNLFRGNASTGAGSRSYCPGRTTRTHPDSRDFVFDANHNLLESDDGGIYRLVNPNLATRRWEAVVGNLRLTEFNSIAFDFVNRATFGGAQDNGSATQTGLGNLTWTSTGGGDGNTQAFVARTSEGVPITERYTLQNNFGSFLRVRSNGPQFVRLGTPDDSTRFSGLNQPDKDFAASDDEFERQFPTSSTPSIHCACWSA